MKPVTSFYELSAALPDGALVSMNEYRDNVVLVVNTASHCGYTPQLEGLESLYQLYHDEGLVVLGFPSNQFKQEFDSDGETGDFCRKNYGVTFPIFSQVKLNGSDAHPLFQFLKREKRGFLVPQIKWNFTKFLINRDGEVVKRFGTLTKPESIERFIKRLL